MLIIVLGIEIGWIIFFYSTLNIAIKILEKINYDEETIAQVEFLLQKKQLKRNEDTQTLEDVICLVFLKYYFEPFVQKHDEMKVIDILRKTWRKMSKKGQETAMRLPFSKASSALVIKAVSG